MRSYLACLFLVLTAWMVSACDDDDVKTPSIQLEFLTVTSNHSGTLVSATTDRKEVLQIAEDKTQTLIKADSTARIAANIELLPGNKAIVYAMASTISPIPLPPTNSVFEEGIKTDPATLLSIWKGYDYLNMLLTVKTYQASHYFHLVEQEVYTDATGVLTVKILLYHDAGADRNDAYNTKRAYTSIPIAQYYSDVNKELAIYFQYHDEANQLQQCGPFYFQQDTTD